MIASKEIAASHEYWKDMARQMIRDPNVSYSEVQTALIGIRNAGDQPLIEQLEHKLGKAWKANLNVLKKVP